MINSELAITAVPSGQWCTEYPSNGAVGMERRQDSGGERNDWLRVSADSQQIRGKRLTSDWLPDNEN